VRQLCWVAWNPRPQSKYNSVLGVPSWSWIGVNCAVKHTDDIWQGFGSGTIEDARCVVPPSNDSLDLVLDVLLLPTNEMMRE